MKKINERPPGLLIDICLNCNSKCIMCGASRDNWNFIDKSMNIEQFKNIINKINPYAVQICPTGEPFMNPDVITMFKYLTEKDINSTTSTNGTLTTKIIKYGSKGPSRSRSAKRPARKSAKVD